MKNPLRWLWPFRKASPASRRPRDVTHLPVLIVATSTGRCNLLRDIHADQPHVRCVAFTDPLAVLRAYPAAITIVMPGINIDQDYHDEGALRAILQSRMRTWGDLATLIVLP